MYIPSLISLIKSSLRTIIKFPMSISFEKVRGITGPLSQIQVDSVNAIMLEVDRQEIPNKAQAAYILATAWHESWLKPIEERGSHEYLDKYDVGKLAEVLGNTPEDDDDGQFYKGRSFVQITGKANYDKFSRILDIDLLRHPEKALEVPIAAKILVYGMKHGTFTGKKLSDYIQNSPDKKDYTRSRRIINGTDKAEIIAEYALKFYKALI